MCAYDGPPNWNMDGSRRFDSPNSDLPLPQKSPKSFSDIKELSRTPMAFLNMDPGDSQAPSEASVLAIPSTAISSMPIHMPPPRYNTISTPSLNVRMDGLPPLYAPTDVAVTIQTLKRRVDVLEANLHDDAQNAQDVISLAVAEDGRNAISFGVKKNRMLALGSFKGPVVWKRDPFMQTLFTSFRSIKNRLETKILAGGKKLQDKDNGPRYLVGLKNMERQVKLRKKMNKMKVSRPEDYGSLRTKMESMFPPENIFKWHLERFFHYIYPFYPIFDEYTVKSYADRIVKYQHPDHKVVLDIEDKSDIVRAATLLLILRLSYISLYLETETENPFVSRKEHLDILLHPIEANAIVLVRMTLEKVNFLRKTSLEDFQLLLLMRMYQIIAPEDGDGGDYTDGTVFVGLLTSTAMCIGLNRKVDLPLNTETFARSNDSFQDLWAKLWKVCLGCDLELSVVYGKKPYLEGSDSDNPSPTVVIRNSNLPNFNIDRFSIGSLAKFGQIYAPLYDLVRMLHRVSNFPTVLEVQEKVASTIFLCERLYPIRNLFANAPQYMRYDDVSLEIVNTVKARLVVDPFLLNVNYYLLVHFEKRNALNNFLSAFDSAVDLSLDCMRLAIRSFNSLFNVMSVHALMLTPYILQAVGKVSQFFLYFAVHLLVVKARLEKRLAGDSERKAEEAAKDQIEKLIGRVAKVMKLIIKCTSISLDHYYSSFRGYGAYACMIGWIENGGKPILNFDDERWEMYPNLLEKFNCEHFRKLNEKLESFLEEDYCKVLSVRNKRWTSDGDAKGVVSLEKESMKMKTDGKGVTIGDYVDDKSNGDPGEQITTDVTNIQEEFPVSSNGTSDIVDPDFLLTNPSFGDTDLEEWLENPEFMDSLDMLADFGLSSF
ncbi:hypothetical protein FOA43_000018 [Brettanomyces nanus]|uniref:Transcription factor domain-containing protein n=1 Tax=Eeniella nana TaxID=13502 RepID=A0A875RSN9_EENNA|nr:uncharacterized protein FOA43_000018 [Brettanomyces nanus]QPG72717.1 hypothetical protein FOA43_000018 [Brettanomyces nanus]